MTRLSRDASSRVSESSMISYLESLRHSRSGNLVPSPHCDCFDNAVKAVRPHAVHHSSMDTATRPDWAHASSLLHPTPIGTAENGVSFWRFGIEFARSVCPHHPDCLPRGL